MFHYVDQNMERKNPARDDSQTVKEINSMDSKKTDNADSVNKNETTDTIMQHKPKGATKNESKKRFAKW